MSTSVLYDVPGPRAVRRNRIIGAATVVIVVALLGFIIYRFADSGQFSASKWNIFTYTTVWTGMLSALWATVSAFVVAGAGSLLFGFVLAIGRLSDHAWVRIPVAWITEAFRAIPLLVMMMLFFYGINSIPGVPVKMEPYVAVVLGLVLYNGAVIAEALRAGIEALPRGQKEAGYAIGLRKSGVMALILLPQAVRNMLPVILSQLVVTLKDTALGFIITYPELLYYAKFLSSQPGRPLLQAGMVVAAIYISMCLVLSGLAKLVESRMRRRERALASEAPGGGGDPALQYEGTMTEVIALRSTRGSSRRRNGPPKQ